jgi:3-oxoacyl-[acyl-carrier protein] reductase
MTKDLIEKKNEELVSNISLNRYGSSEEVAKVILFLCSESSSYITGEIIEISGGKFLVQNQKDSKQ